MCLLVGLWSGHQRWLYSVDQFPVFESRGWSCWTCQSLVFPGRLRPQSHTFFTFFHFFFTRPKKKVKKSRSHTKKFPTPKKFSLFNSNPQSALFTYFSLWAKMGGGLRRPPARPRPRALGSQSCKTPRNLLFGILYVGKNIYLGRMFEETQFPYMVYTRDLCSMQH